MPNNNNRASTRGSSSATLVVPRNSPLSLGNVNNVNNNRRNNNNNNNNSQKKKKVKINLPGGGRRNNVNFGGPPIPAPRGNSDWKLVSINDDPRIGKRYSNLRYQVSQIPRVNAALSKWPQVRAAFENIFNLDSLDPGAPAPVYSNSKKLLCGALKGFVLGLVNYAPDESKFHNIILQFGNSKTPILITDSLLSGTTFCASNSNAVNYLEVSGQKSWGLWWSARHVAAVLSSALAVTGYPNIDNMAHVWTFVWPASPDSSHDVVNFIVTATGGGPSFILYTRLNQSGDFVASQSVNGGASIQLTIPTTNTIFEVALYVNNAPSEKLNFVMAVQPAEDTPYPHDLKFINWPVNPPYGYTTWPYNLSPLPTNYNDVLQNSEELRLNTSMLVLTNTNDNMYRGGNVLCGNITSNEPPVVSYPSYLYNLPKSRLGDLKFGNTSCFFASSGGMFLTAPQAQPLNPFNCPDSTVNMIDLTHTAQGGGSNDTLDIQVKYRSWVDYTTSNNALNPKDVVPINDEWTHIMGEVYHCYQFSDNPLHEQIMRGVKNAVKFIMSGDSRAVAIRKAAMTVSKAAGAALLAAL